MSRTAFQISLSVTMAHASPVWSLLNLLGKTVLNTNWSAPVIKPQMAKLKVQLKLLKVDWEGCQVEHWKQSFHSSYSPIGQHPILQLELHEQNCGWKGSYRQIRTGRPSTSTIVFLSQDHQEFHHDRTAKMRMFHKGLEVFAQNFNSSPGWLAGHILEGIEALSILINLQDGRVIRCHQDHTRTRFCSSEPMSPTPETRANWIKIATTLGHNTPGSHSRHNNARESSNLEINCWDVNPTATIFPRSRSTTINCCDVNPTATTCSRNRGTWTFQSRINFGSDARTHK